MLRAGMRTSTQRMRTSTQRMRASLAASGDLLRLTSTKSQA
jgi:hypothetical protein